MRSEAVMGADNGPQRPRRWRIAVWGFAVLMLLLPLAAMQFNDEMVWDGFDFAVFGAMLLAACGAYELAARMTSSFAYRTAAGIAIAAAFLLVWINLAVGIIGSEDNPANLMYGALLAIGIGGAVVARGKPNGMARALVAMAITQALIGVIAYIARWGSEGENWPQPVFVLNGFFAALWVLSAWLFWKAAREQTPAPSSRVGRSR